jgi:hypothetical protein
VLWAKNFVLIYFLFPYLMFMGAIFLYFFRHLGHVLLHMGVLALMSHFFLQVTVLFQPALPFSQPQRKGQRSSSMIITMMFGPMFGMLLLFAFVRFLYPHLLLLLAVLAAMLAASWGLEKILILRIQRRTVFLEYQE